MPRKRNALDESPRREVKPRQRSPLPLLRSDSAPQSSTYRRHTPHASTPFANILPPLMALEVPSTSNADALSYPKFESPKSYRQSPRNWMMDVWSSLHDERNVHRREAFFGACIAFFAISITYYGPGKSSIGTDFVTTFLLLVHSVSRRSICFGVIVALTAASRSVDTLSYNPVYLLFSDRFSYNSSSDSVTLKHITEWSSAFLDVLTFIMVHRFCTDKAAVAFGVVVTFLFAAEHMQMGSPVQIVNCGFLLCLVILSAFYLCWLPRFFALFATLFTTQVDPEAVRRRYSNARNLFILAVGCTALMAFVDQIFNEAQKIFLGLERATANTTDPSTEDTIVGSNPANYFGCMKDKRMKLLTLEFIGAIYALKEYTSDYWKSLEENIGATWEKGGFTQSVSLSLNVLNSNKFGMRAIDSVQLDTLFPDNYIIQLLDEASQHCDTEEGHKTPTGAHHPFIGLKLDSQGEHTAPSFQDSNAEKLIDQVRCYISSKFGSGSIQADMVPDSVVASEYVFGLTKEKPKGIGGINHKYRLLLVRKDVLKTIASGTSVITDEVVYGTHRRHVLRHMAALLSHNDGKDEASFPATIQSGPHESSIKGFQYYVVKFNETNHCAEANCKDVKIDEDARSCIVKVNRPWIVRQRLLIGGNLILTSPKGGLHQQIS